jgi:DNA-binding LacI/PurR family transcriptional regulator
MTVRHANIKRVFDFHSEPTGAGDMDILIAVIECSAAMGVGGRHDHSAMRSHGLTHHAKVIPGAHNEHAGAAAARVMLAEPELPTAVLAGNDRCALGLLDVFTRAGVDVPGQLSLIGYDDSRLSDNPRIDLTTVHQDAAGLARQSVQLAVGMLEQKRIGPEDVVLEPKLVVRGTTTNPRKM